MWRSRSIEALTTSRGLCVEYPEGLQWKEYEERTLVLSLVADLFSIIIQLSFQCWDITTNGL